MPELPEVELCARSLRGWLRGVEVVRAEADATRIFRGGGRVAFRRSLPGRALERLDRRGKVLLLAFDEEVGLLAHLGMTGRWVRRAGGASLAEGAPRHSRARLVLSDGATLHYCDPRLFGRIAVHRASDLLELPVVRALGPDPLLDGIDPAALHVALARTSRPVKVAIMDQALIAGVGNIYATEALFAARVHPSRAARSLTRNEVGRLARGIQEAFAAALERGGEEVEYLSDGAHVENPFRVYDRAGDPCPRCRHRLEKVSIGGRTSAFCGSCQK